MRFASAIAVVVTFAAMAMGRCLPISEAPSRVGDAACITGEVQKVIVSEDGSHHLDFCGDSTTSTPTSASHWSGAPCPFSAVVLPRYLRDVGDVRQLEGKTIEIYGKITAYHGRPEMLLRDIKQLRGEASKIPPIPKGYDVEKRGYVKAGQFKATKQVRPTSKKSLYKGGSIEDEMSSEN
jgi:hypothetical protein